MLGDWRNRNTLKYFKTPIEILRVNEVKTRKSTTSENGFKTFKSLTNKGLEFGKNMISPLNQLETQPHYFENKFLDLLKLLELKF